MCRDHETGQGGRYRDSVEKPTSEVSGIIDRGTRWETVSPRSVAEDNRCQSHWNLQPRASSLPTSHHRQSRRTGRGTGSRNHVFQLRSGTLCIPDLRTLGLMGYLLC